MPKDTKEAFLEGKLKEFDEKYIDSTNVAQFEGVRYIRGSADDIEYFLTVALSEAWDRGRGMCEEHGEVDCVTCAMHQSLTTKNH